jgi:hypothetical protein
MPNDERMTKSKESVELFKSLASFNLDSFENRHARGTYWSRSLGGGVADFKSVSSAFS